ncbi:M1-specific T cell receptor beta chain-like [Thunnus albacares]|uniref:M1-specific T cell receptor beta chain-like n=1 Tax=Thunnus albacares TaxID=8236 RepID=UPI001CF6F520|nr:M1-specific T cell receptor beta chain-like [Thunnus albacares]
MIEYLDTSHISVTLTICTSRRDTIKHHPSCAAGLSVVVLQSGDQMFHPGDTVMLECSMGPGFSMGSHTMFWYRQNHYGAQLQFIIKEYDQTVGRFQMSIDTSKNNFSLKITELFLNDSSTYYCAARRVVNYEPAYFGSGTRLTVLENDRNVTAPTVKVLPPPCNQRDKQRKKTLVCVATGFYPDHVSVFWQIDGVNVINGVATDNAALQEGNGNYSITSRLRVSATVWYKPKSNFTCIVSFFNGTETKNYQNSIFGKKDTEGKMTRSKYLKITNNAKHSYGVFIVKSSVYGAFVVFLVWKLQGKHN